MFKFTRDYNGDMENKSHLRNLGISMHIPANSGIYKHIQSYSGIIQTHSEPCVILAYSEPRYIQNPGIFRARGIFRTLVYSELWHVQNQQHI